MYIHIYRPPIHNTIGSKSEGCGSGTTAISVHVPADVHMLAMPDRGERDSESFEHASVFIGDGVFSALECQAHHRVHGEASQGKAEACPRVCMHVFAVLQSELHLDCHADTVGSI